MSIDDSMFGKVLELPASRSGPCASHSGCNCDDYEPCDQCNPDDD